MGIKKVKANTPGRRLATFDDFKDITTSTPEKSLLLPKRERVDAMLVVRLLCVIVVVELKETFVLLI